MININTKNISEDIIVIAGDNIFDFSLQDVTTLFSKVKSNIIVLHDVKDMELAKKYGVVEVENNVVVGFEEKPTRPRSTLISTG
ncbi:MAG: NDP-sugar synthase, partial [Candidatus Heimdallarchaeota archaeon]|nr:NDP-sugar synthase [Candidatus Heimdallarchaeota archaeon]